MTVVTRISFRSGDRDLLDSVVGDIVETSRQKGAEFKGPHLDPPEDHEVALYRRLDGDPTNEFDAWTYTVFQRRIVLRGYDDLAREFLERDYPDSVQVEAEVE